MQDSPRRANHPSSPGDPVKVPRLRRRFFMRMLVAFSAVMAATLIATWFAERVAISRNGVLTIGLTTGLGIGALLAMLWSARFEHRVRQLMSVIEAGSPALGEELAHESLDKLFSEVVRALQSSVRNLQKSWVEKQDEARRNHEALTDLIRMMAKAVDERVTYLRGHSDRVAHYAAAIADKMGLDEKQVEQIRLAGLLHDIGTLGIEDYLVTKDAPLAPDEFEIVKAHTVKGAAILRPIEMLNDLIPGVELHHESLDGMGYPYGLKGDEIPLMARIISVADSFDAMTTPRPYQAAMNSEYVLEIMKRLTGTRYDPAVVNALTVLVRSGAVEVKPMRIPVSFRMRRPMVETA